MEARWPFYLIHKICSCPDGYAAKRYKLAEKKLIALTRLIRLTRSENLEFGFNEWVKAQDEKPKGNDWQTWSASMYLYAAKCVEEKNTPFFDEIRKQ